MTHFYHIILNSPYKGNLHLKILQEAMKHSDDVVNLSPIRWLQDPLAEYKKNSDWKKFADIRKHIESLDVVSKDDAIRLFNAGFTMDLGVYHITESGGWDSEFLWKHKDIIRKVHEKMYASFADKVEHNKSDGWRCKVTELYQMYGDGTTETSRKYRRIINPNVETTVFYNGRTEDGRHWTKLVAKGGFDRDETYEIPTSIKFDTKEEAYNFEAYCELKLPNALKCWCQKDVHVPLLIFPFMPTYTHPWTDEMLYEYFELTSEQVNIIEEAIK